MAENLIPVAANLGFSKITCLIFWFCSMFPGSLTENRSLQFDMINCSLEKKTFSICFTLVHHRHSWTMMLQSGVETAGMCLSSV
jgi:hypothetical protein